MLPVVVVRRGAGDPNRNFLRRKFRKRVPQLPVDVVLDDERRHLGVRRDALRQGMGAHNHRIHRREDLFQILRM